jgi:hypothetical protein
MVGLHVKSGIDPMDLHELKEKVSGEIAGYVYAHSGTLVGNPPSSAKISEYLAELRSALVVPYWAEFVRRDTASDWESADPPTYQCAVVADDRAGILLAYDPEVNVFLLIRHGSAGLESFGVSGDVV